MARGVILAAGEWECLNCGYIKAGLADQGPRKCPECGAGADRFAFFDYVEDYYAPKERRNAHGGEISEPY